MERRLLLGFTKDMEVVFADVDNSRGHFSVCFDASYPQAISEEDEIEQIKSLIEHMEKDWVLEKLEGYDCKPSELAEKIHKDTYDVVEEFFDTSLYPESFQLDKIENDVYFLASGSGQHDTRGEINWTVNRALYNRIHELWDEYHLKEIPKKIVDELFEAIEHQKNTINEYEVIKQYLESNFN